MNEEIKCDTNNEGKGSVAFIPVLKNHHSKYEGTKLSKYSVSKKKKKNYAIQQTFS